MREKVMLPNKINVKIRKILCGIKPTDGKITIKTPVATNKPLKIPPVMKPTVNSIAVKGGIKVSTILPLTLETKIDVEVFAKAFCKVTIIKIPGARNWL